MSSYHTLLSSLCEIAVGVQALQHQAVEEYTPVVEAIPALLLYRRLCRHYFEIDPAATVGYVQAYREMWDTEEAE